MLIVDKDAILVVSGTGEVIAPDDDLKLQQFSGNLERAC